MKTPSLHIARLEAELAERCLELAEARQRIRELELTLQHVEWNVGERIKKTSPPK